MTNATDPDLAGRRPQTRLLANLRAGTASFLDTALTTLGSNLADKARRLDRDGATARGVLAIAAGIALLVWPEASLSVMSTAAAAYFIADGALTLLGLLTPDQRRWQLAAQGVASLTVGVLALLWPAVTATALLYLLALWVIVMGAFRLHNAVRIADRAHIAWVPAILSTLSIVAGATALTFPIRDVRPVLINIGDLPHPPRHLTHRQHPPPHRAGWLADDGQLRANPTAPGLAVCVG
jgi:uncharacterized membrane protein HdeD (DUF308 family)